MPHMTIEYSANLDAKVDIAELCDVVRQAMLSTGMFETGGVRVRAIRCEAYSVADALPENAFVAMTLRIAPGRAAEDRKTAGEAIFAAAKDHLGALFEAPHFSLSLDMSELDSGFSWKQNSMHARLRGE
jgi:5-carboxymethyl-2-hydroxymuconate isomerase